MRLIVMDAVSGVIRSVNDSLRSLSRLELDSLPAVRREAVSGEGARVRSPEDSFTSVVGFQRLGPVKRGALAIRIMRKGVESVFSEFGINSRSESPVIKDAFSEFSNIVSGAFKTEMENFGYKDIQLSAPKNFADRVDEPVEAGADCSYVMDFTLGDKPLFTAEVFLEESS